MKYIMPNSARRSEHRSRRLFFLTGFVIFFSSLLLADSPPSQGFEDDVEIGVNERLGRDADLDYTFVDANGDTVRIAQLVERPTIVNFVYFSCPGICSPLLEGLQETVNLIKMEPGVDFDVLTISIRDDETPADAARRRKDFMQRFTREIPVESWTWLTGDSANIAGFSNELGFSFKRVGDDFAHSAVLIVLDGKGMVSRYIYGTSFNPFNLQLAIMEATSGGWGPSMAGVIKFCFSYDPEGRGYALNITRITGASVLLGVLILFLTLTLKGKGAKSREVS